jgi:cytochrome c oxidase subunit 2
MVLLSACGGGSETSDAEPVTAEAPRDPNAPGLHQLGPDRYEVVVYADVAGFNPAEIRVPAGAEITFRGRSQDIPHGLFIEGLALKLPLGMEDFSRITHTFPERGEHVFFCDEYCGGGHEAMRGRIIVE